MKEYPFEKLFSAHIHDIRRGKDGQCVGRCPFHQDNKSSLSFHIQLGMWKCHAGCGGGGPVAFSRMIRARAHQAPDPSKTAPIAPPGPKRKVAEYIYRDEAGNVLFRKDRFEPKNFNLWRRKGQRWVSGLDDVRRVLYKLPELLASAANDGTVFIVEGEKDVDNLRKIGLVAVTNFEGSGGWKDEYADYLKGRKVVVLPDNDSSGQKWTHAVTCSLSGKAANIKVLALPSLPPSGDVSDWIEKGGTAEALVRLADKTSDWTSERELPKIDLSNQDLKGLTKDAWSAIQKANDPPQLFRHGGIVRLEADDDGRPLLREMTPNRMRHFLARAAQWARKDKSTLPPLSVVQDVLATPDFPLPILNRIVEVPIYASDGSLHQEPGYNAASKALYVPQPGFRLPAVPARPTLEDVQRARRIILDELLSDFPFISDAERAHAIAFMLGPIVREMISGSTPLHLFDAPSPGTGKTLLLEVCAFPAQGRFPAIMTEGGNEDEWRKRITAKLREGPSVILIDNIQRKLDSAALSAAITIGVWEDRILGRSESVRLPVKCIWAATGNNVELSHEMSRRTLRIRLDSKQDMPWRRESFKHSDLKEWTRLNRAQLVWAMLVLVQAWIVEGRPPFNRKPLGGMESWSNVIGGILEVAMIPGLLGNLDALYAASDVEGMHLRALVKAWYERFGERIVKVAELYDWMTKTGESTDLLGEGNEQTQKIRLGRLLTNKRDRQFDGLKIVDAGSVHGSNRWRVVKVPEGGVGGSGGSKPKLVLPRREAGEK